MKKVGLQLIGFNEYSLFFNWASDNLHPSIWNKLRWEGFKVGEFWRVSDEFGDVRL